MREMRTNIYSVPAQQFIDVRPADIDSLGAPLQVLDYIVERMEKQGMPGQSPSKCSYRLMKDGQTCGCGIGQLIPDVQYSPSLDTGDAGGSLPSLAREENLPPSLRKLMERLNSWFSVKKIPLPYYTPSPAMSLLNSVQSLHDGLDIHQPWEDWLRKFKTGVEEIKLQWHLEPDNF